VARRAVIDLPDCPVSGQIHRLINSRFPTVGIFDDLGATAEEARAGFLLEGLSNDRTDGLAAARLSLLSDDDIVTGDGATLVMAAFLHANPEGGRFTDHRLDAWYASLKPETALAEVIFHNHRRLAASEGGFPNRLQVRQLVASVDGQFDDIRRGPGIDPQQHHRWHDPDMASYADTQHFGTARRWPASGAGSNGILYDSVRDPGGINLCVFRPRCIALPVVQGAHYQIDWTRDGQHTLHRLDRINLQSG